MKGNKITEGVKNGLKRGKPTIKQGPTLERSKPMKNGKSENNSRHKRLRMSGKMHKGASRPWQTHEQQAFDVHGKWSTRKVQALPTCTQPIQEWWVMSQR